MDAVDTPALDIEIVVVGTADTAGYGPAPGGVDQQRAVIGMRRKGNPIVLGRSYRFDLCTQVPESDSDCPRDRTGERGRGTLRRRGTVLCKALPRMVCAAQKQPIALGVEGDSIGPLALDHQLSVWSNSKSGSG